MLPLLLLPPLLPHPPLAFVPVPAWVFRLELVSGIFGFGGCQFAHLIMAFITSRPSPKSGFEGQQVS